LLTTGWFATSGSSFPICIARKDLYLQQRLELASGRRYAAWLCTCLGWKILAWFGMTVPWLLDLYAYAWFVGFGVAQSPTWSDEGLSTLSGYNRSRGGLVNAYSVKQTVSLRFVG